MLHSILVNEATAGFFWSVCFSPDSKLLATGAGDGVVRVSSRAFTLARIIAVVIFQANAQRRTTLDTLDLGYCQEANPQKIPGSHPGDPLARVLVGREIACLRVGRLYDEDLGYDRRVVEDPSNHRQR